MRWPSASWPLAVALGQALLLATLYVLAQGDAAPEGTSTARVEVLIPTLVLAAAAVVGLRSACAVGGAHLAARPTVWALETLTIVMTAFLAMALLGELIFGGMG